MQQDTNGRSLTLTLGEAARELAISRSQAYVLANRGELPVVRVGTRMRVVRAALEEQLARQLETSSAKP
jgi:excisionase family DNA binding protein